VFVGQFGAIFEDSVFAECRKVWDGSEGVSVVFCVTVLGSFGGVSVCCVFDSLGLVLGSECVLCVGHFGAGCGGFVGVILCCV